jgi:hypothetical protein
MDYLRILKVPIHPTVLMLVGMLTPVMAICLWAVTQSLAGPIGYLGVVFVQIWVLKYGYVLVQRLSDGAAEPPVLDNDMLSPGELRPWAQLALIGGIVTLSWFLGGNLGFLLVVLLVLWTPVSIAILGHGEPPWEALNPVTVFRVVRGFGAHYFLLLAAMFLGVLLVRVFIAGALPQWLTVALFLWYEVSFFGLVGGLMFARRRQIGYEPSRSPERTAAREERERETERAKMLDDIYQQVRVGKHVEATSALATWLANLDHDVAVRDSLFVLDKALTWERPAALNPIGSTLIRHLLRFGRPDAALLVFEKIRQVASRFTMDSAHDLRTLAEYADSVGRGELAASMRLETPVFQSPA